MDNRPDADELKTKFNAILSEIQNIEKQWSEHKRQYGDKAVLSSLISKHYENLIGDALRIQEQARFWGIELAEREARDD